MEEMLKEFLRTGQRVRDPKLAKMFRYMNYA